MKIFTSDGREKAIPPETAINLQLKTARAFDCQWVCALLPSPPIFAGPQANGGATILAANSAALYELAGLSFDELETLGRAYADWLDEGIEAKKDGAGKWSHDMAVDIFRGRRQVLVYDCVYRELDRKLGRRAIEEMLGAAAMWDFANRPRNEQFTAIRYVENRHLEQLEIDEQAINALNQIYSAA